MYAPIFAQRRARPIGPSEMRAKGLLGLGAMPPGALDHPIAHFVPIYGRGYDIGELVPARASHFLVAQRRPDQSMDVNFYSSSLPPSGNQLLTTETFHLRAAAPPPSGTAPTAKLPGTTTTPTTGKGPPSGPRPAPYPGGGVTPPGPYPYTPVPQSTTPEWVVPGAIATVVLVAAFGLYLASQKKRRAPARVAANRRRRRRRRPRR